MKSKKKVAALTLVSAFAGVLIAGFTAQIAYEKVPALHFEAQRYVSKNKTHFADAVSAQIGLELRPGGATLCHAQILKNAPCLPLVLPAYALKDEGKRAALRELVANPCEALNAAHSLFYLRCSSPPAERPVIILQSFN